MPKATSSPVKNKQPKCLTCCVRFHAQGYLAHVKKCLNEQEVCQGERKHMEDLEERLSHLDTLGAQWTLALNLYLTIYY
jgi:hypothetical protein